MSALQNYILPNNKIEKIKMIPINNMNFKKKNAPNIKNGKFYK